MCYSAVLLPQEEAYSSSMDGLWDFFLTFGLFVVRQVRIGAACSNTDLFTPQVL